MRPPRPLLVGIRPTGAKPPFFCVHPCGGHVLHYVYLARHISPEHPFYGFQARGLDGQPPHTQIEEMAADYIAALRTVQPHGPYFLGGWSIGSVVAYEMAQQLAAAGETIALLALLDGWAPRSTRRRAEALDDATTLIMFGQTLGLPWEQIVALQSGARQRESIEQLARVLEKAKQANIIPADFELSETQRFYATFKANIQAYWRYVPHPYAGRITLFSALEALDISDAGSRAASRSSIGRLLWRGRAKIGAILKDQALGWGQLAGGGIKIYNVPGNHYTMFAEPHVQQLAKQLQSCFDESLASQ